MASCRVVAHQRSWLRRVAPVRRARLIAVVGVDGSGKSTQAKLLARTLVGEGVRARYFENAGGRPVLDWIAHRLGKENGRALIGPRGVVATETFVRRLAIARSLRWARRTGGVAVMDRYAVCQYAVMRARGDGGEPRVRAKFRRFPQPDIVVFFAVPPADAVERVALRGKDREELAHLVAYDAAYRALPEFATFEVLDASRSIDEVQAELRRIVDHVVRGGLRSTRE
jgi:dTMP kinase